MQKQYKTINVYPDVHKAVKQLALDEELKVLELIPKLIEVFKEREKQPSQ